MSLCINVETSKLRYLPTAKSNLFGWNKAVLMFREKKYDVLVSKDHAFYPLLMRPCTKYYCGSFEEIFKFKFECSDFSIDKIIAFVDFPIYINS